MPVSKQTRRARLKRRETQLFNGKVGDKLPTMTSRTLNPELESKMGPLAKDKGDFGATGQPRKPRVSA